MYVDQVGLHIFGKIYSLPHFQEKNGSFGKLNFLPTKFSISQSFLNVF
jgi:hypothetical protein